jgi:hypothetical protein
LFHTNSHSLKELRDAESSSFPRTRESSLSRCNLFWIPAFAGMTDKRLLVLLRPYVTHLNAHSYQLHHSARRRIKAILENNFRLSTRVIPENTGIQEELAPGVRRDDGNVPFGKNFRETLYQTIGFSRISRMIREKAKNQEMHRK